MNLEKRNLSRPVFFRMGFIGSFVLSLFMLAIGGCQEVVLVGPSEPPTTTPRTLSPSPTSPPELPQAEVSFDLTAPANTPTDASVFLTVVDEVTGLALNPQRFPMEQISVNHYHLNLPFPLGSLITYRYERQVGNATVVEHISDGRPVRYRLFHVTGPGGVEDIVSRWTDTPFQAASGRIRGQVLDAESDQGVENALVIAGGAPTFTASDGSFDIEGLPEGVHNLVVFSPDGSYRTFQQGARVAAESTTPAEIRLEKAQQVEVNFQVRLPDGTLPVVPVRLAGNLLQLGNTFASLSGGMSGLADRMPSLQAGQDGTYSLSLKLPAGADIRYKYTLGDGFWNAEHSQDGGFRLRQLIVPDHDITVQEEVDSWTTSEHKPVIFDLKLDQPAQSPAQASIQFLPVFGWTEPIPMWQLDPNHWAYILYSPLNLPGDLFYRYCLDGDCEGNDEAADAGQVMLRPLPATGGDQILNDEIRTPPEQTAYPVTVPDTRQARTQEFLAGIELAPTYHPAMNAHFSHTLDEIQQTGSNWLVLSPTWTFLRQNPPVFEQVAGLDPMPVDVQQFADQARAQGQHLALYPQPNFPMDMSQWWQTAQPDYGWWLTWFDRYRTFLLHNAHLAATTGAEALIIGGNWVSPALPGAHLPDGSPSGLPADMDRRWGNLLVEVRQQYSGEIWWALPADQVDDPPPFIGSIDRIYLILPGENVADGSFEKILDNGLLTLHMLYDKPVITATAPQEGVTEDQQVDAYQAILNAINDRDWIEGFVSQGFTPAGNRSKTYHSHSNSPIGMVLKAWFPFLIGPGPG